MQRMLWRSFVDAQAEPRRHKTKRAARAGPSSITGSHPRALKVELLREPNHHQRKSNQKEEEARACVVVLRSHFRTAVRLVARPSGPSGQAGFASLPDRAENDFALCAATRELFRCAP